MGILINMYILYTIVKILLYFVQYKYGMRAWEDMEF